MRNVGTANDAQYAREHAASMQSTTTRKEALMVKSHLSRLFVMVVTGAIIVASFVPMALAGAVRVK